MQITTIATLLAGPNMATPAGPAAKGHDPSGMTAEFEEIIAEIAGFPGQAPQEDVLSDAESEGETIPQDTPEIAAGTSDSPPEDQDVADLDFPDVSPGSAQDLAPASHVPANFDTGRAERPIDIDAAPAQFTAIGSEQPNAGPNLASTPHQEQDRGDILQAAARDPASYFEARTDGREPPEAPLPAATKTGLPDLAADTPRDDRTQIPKASVPAAPLVEPARNRTNSDIQAASSDPIIENNPAQKTIRRSARDPGFAAMQPPSVQHPSAALPVARDPAGIGPMTADATVPEIDNSAEMVGRDGRQGPQPMTDTARMAQVASGTRADAPRIASQIVEQVRMSPGEPRVEVILEPKELGRVKISLTGSEGTMAVNVMSERAETLDLLKRHVSLLASEFRDIGYGNPSFSFGQSGAEERQSGNNHASENGQSDGRDLGPGAPIPIAQIVVNDRIDIRL